MTLSPKNIKHLIILFLGIIFALGTKAQSARIANPVDVSVLLTPPYSPFVADLYSVGSNRLRSTLVFRDVTETSVDVRLSLKIVSGNGSVIITKPNFVPLNRITLVPNVPFTVSGEQWAEYFNANNLSFTGIDASLFSEKGIFPEGQYTFYVEALDYNSGKFLSCSEITAYDRNFAIGNFVLGGIPQVIMPKQNFVTPLSPQNIMFQWIMTAPPLYPATTAYKLFLYELTNDGVSPEVALKNGNVVKIFESNELKSMTFMYDASAPVLELGKKYVYYVKVYDNQDTAKAIFRNNGLSEPGWFTFGYPIGGNVPLKQPAGNYQFKPSDRQIFSWEVIDNKAISTQPVSYKLKVVKMNSKDQDSVEAIKHNVPIYEETTQSSTSNSGWTSIVKETFEKNQWFAWQVQAFSGEQMVAQSEIRTFKGAPLLEKFRAGDHDVFVKETQNLDFTNLTGTGIVKISADGKQTAEIDFKNIKLQKVGNMYFLEEGELYKDIKDGTPIEIQPKKSDFKVVKFIPTGVKLDSKALSLKGNFSIPVDVVLDGDEPNVVVKERWMNFNSFNLKGGVKLEGTYDLLEPLNFQLSIDTNSRLIIGATGYQIYYYGSVVLPDGIFSTKRERIKIPFNNLEYLKYIELDAEAMAIEFPSYRPVNNVNHIITPKKVVLDFSSSKSPGNFDNEWRGCYIAEYSFINQAKFDNKSNRVSFENEKTKDISLAIESNTKNWFTSQGLQYNYTLEFGSNEKTWFNTFLSQPMKFNVVVENSEIKEGEYRGTVKLPLIDETRNFEVYSKLNKDGFQEGYLQENLEGEKIYFSKDAPESKAILTIKQILFSGEDHLNMTVDLSIPYIKVKVNNISNFNYYGDYQIGFERRNGIAVMHEQVIGVYDNLFKLVFENFGAAFQGGKYVYYASTTIDMAQDARGAAGGPVKVNIFGSQEANPNLGIKNDYSSAPVVSIPPSITEKKPDEVPLVDSIDFKLDCGMAKLEGRVGIKKNDPTWGTCFNGSIKGKVYAPSEINCGSTIIIGKTLKGLDYWFFDVFMYDQGRGVPLVPGVVNIVGLEGRMFRHMSAKVGSDGKSAQIKIDEKTKYGAGLYAQLIDAATNGQNVKADIGIELNVLEGDFQMAMKGQATILNLQGRSASSAVTNKASSAVTQQAVAQAESALNSKEIKVGDWVFKPEIKSAEGRGGLNAKNGSTEIGFGANVMSKSAYFKYSDNDWAVSVAGNKTPASFAFDFKKKTGSDAFGIGIAYLPGDSMGLNFTSPKFGIGGAYYDRQKKASFRMHYDDFKIGVMASKETKQFALSLQPNKDININTAVDLNNSSGNFGLRFPGTNLVLAYQQSGASVKYNDNFELAFDKDQKKGKLAIDIEKNKFAIEGSPKSGSFLFENAEYKIGAGANIETKSGNFYYAGKGYKVGFDLDLPKRKGSILFENEGDYFFNVGTKANLGGGFFNLAWPNNDKLSIDFDIVKKNGSLIYAIGGNNFSTALTNDSAMINTTINGISLYASAHKAGRGGIRYSDASNTVSLFGDKEGRGNLLVKTGSVLVNVAADKTTGSGLVRYKLNNDTLYLLADRSKGIADISTKFGDNVFQLGYNAEGRGRLKVITSGNTIGLEGDKAGSGEILFARSGFLINAAANVPNKEGKLRLQINSDSIGAYFSAANGGRVNAAFGNNYFAGSADPSGKGNLSIKVGGTILQGQADPNGLNSVFFKDGDIYLSTGLNKTKQLGYFGFRKSSDSINAVIDKLNKKYSLAAAYSGNAFAGYYNDGKKGGLSLNAANVKLSIEAEKSGVGLFNFESGDNKAYFYGDKTAGNANVAVRIGKDSLTTNVTDGKKFNGAIAFGDFAMSYNYADDEDKFYKYENGSTLLHGYSKLNGLNGGIFKTSDNKVILEAQSGGKGIVGVKIAKDSLLLGINDNGRHSIDASIGDNKLNASYIKDGYKFISAGNKSFSLLAKDTTGEKLVDLKIGTDKRIRLSSTKYAYLNVNSHEFKMDATKENRAYFYIDGREVEYNASDNKDSVSFSYKGDGADFLVAAHRQGRGHLTFTKDDKKLYIFADKAGAGRISAGAGKNLFDISGNKGTGNGALRLLLGDDSLNILADRSAGIASLGSKFGANSMYANYNKEGYGNISLTAAGNYIALGGDASGSGNITFKNSTVLAAAAADVKALTGKLRFKMDNDSINAGFDGAAGNAALAASFGGNAFSGSADKSGVGSVDFNSSSVKLNAALDPKGLNKVYFNKDNLTFSANNNKSTNYSSLLFRLENDSVSAFADKNAKIYSFATSISGTSLNARLENGTTAQMAFATGETKLSLRASKAGSGLISYADASNSFYLEGDRTTGNASFRLRPGSDSLTGSITDGKAVKGTFAVGSTSMAFGYAKDQNNYLNFKSGDNNLNAFYNTDNSRGAKFENKDVKINLYNEGQKGLASLKMGKDSVYALINDQGTYTFAASYAGNSLITTYNKTADKNIKLTSSAFNLTAGVFGEEKMVDFSFDSNKRLKVSSTKFVQLQANSHEFKMDARGAGNPLFYIDGKEVAYDFNKDSVQLGWSGDDKIFNVMAHRLGRGRVRFKVGDNDVSLFANKETGSAGVKLKVSQNFFQLEGNKTTGSGLLNIAIGADSVNLMADRQAGIASLSTNFNGASLRARYDNQGKGYLNFAQSDKKISLAGDASGSGSIYLQKGDNLIAANADINAQIGGFRLKAGSDSVNTSYNGTLGEASLATSISGASFIGKANKSGKGNLELNASNLRLKAAADDKSNEIYFKKDDFLIAANNNKTENSGNFRLLFGKDSLNAFVNANSNSAGFTTLVGDVALSGEIREGIKGKLGVKVGTTSLYAAAEKQGSATFTYTDANNKFSLYGDKTTGEGALNVKMGSDSLVATAIPGKYTGALAIGDLGMAYQHQPGGNSFYRFSTSGVSLNGFMKPDNSKGIRFSYGSQKVALENSGSKGLVSFRKDNDSLNVVVNDEGKHSFIGSLDNNYIETSYKAGGDKSIKLNTSLFGIAARYGSDEKALDLTFDNKRINVSSKKFVLLQANSHEFKMDATNEKENPKFFIDGSEVKYEIGNKDSVSLGWEGGSDLFRVFAHRAGRGGLRFKKGDNDVSFYVNKSGSGRIAVSTGSNAFMIAGDKNAGYGAMRFKVGSDSINVLSDDASGVRRISTAYSGNSLFAGYENGMGTVSMDAANTKIKLKGDANGSGSVYFEKSDFLAAASADQSTKVASMRLKLGNDSINTNFNGSEGAANLTAAYGGSAFRGSADKTGRGDVRLTANGLTLVGQTEPGGLNAISFKKDQFLFAASNDNKKQLNSFRVRNGNDSLNAFVDKQNDISSVATSVSGTSLGARLENGNNGVLTIANQDFKMDFASQKANSAKLNLVKGDNRFMAFGDKSTGDMAMGMYLGNDSLVASALSGNYKGSFALGGKKMAFAATGLDNNSFSYEDGTTTLKSFVTPNVGKGLSFATGDKLFKIENATGDKGLFTLKAGKDSVYSLINDNGKHTFAAAYGDISFNTQYKKDGDKSIKLQGADYLVEAAEKATDKFINLTYKNYAVNVNNKRKASFNSGSHSFDLDASNAEIPKLFIDGKEFSFDASQLKNKDSIAFGLTLGNYIINTSAHVAGRGQFRFKSSSDEVALWGNKGRENRVYVNTSGTLLDLSGNPNTGKTALRFKLNGDSINLKANPELTAGSIAAAFGAYAFAGNYDGEGKGAVSFKNGNDFVNIKGDASGSGEIKLLQSGIKVNAEADINAKKAAFAFANGKDSLSTSLNGIDGKAAFQAAFGDNTFEAKGEKSGLASLALYAGNIKLTAGLNPEGNNFINYKMDDFAYRASANKGDGVYAFSFLKGEDSLAATLDKKEGMASLKAYLVKNELGAFMNSLGRVNFTLNNPDFYFDLMAQSKGVGTIRYSGANGSGNFYGDVNNGFFNLKSRWGKDSMFVIGANNKPFTGGFASASTGLAFQLNGDNGHYFTFLTSDAELNIVKGAAAKDASLNYKNGNTAVRLLSTSQDKAEFAIRQGDDSVSAKLNPTTGTHTLNANIQKNSLTASFVKDGDKKLIFNGSGYSIENVYAVNALKYAKFTRNGVGVKVSSDKKILVTTGTHEVLLTVSSSNEPELYIDGVKQKLNPDVKFTLDGIDFLPSVNMDITMFKISLPNFPEINVGFDKIGLPSIKLNLPSLPNVNLDFVHLPNGFSFDFDGRLFSFDANIFKFNLPSFKYDLDFSLPSLGFNFQLPAVDFKWRGLGDFDIDFTNNFRFELTKEYAKALYLDKYLMLDKNLLAKLSYDDNKYVTYQINASAPKTLGKITMKFDDLSGQFEKDKLLELNYQNAGVKLEPSAASLVYSDKSFTYDATAKSLKLKNGATDFITLEPKAVATQWLGYSASLGSDSVSFAKDDAVLNVGSSSVKIAKAGKYVHANKTSLNLFYDANTFIKAGYDKVDAQLSDAKISYATGEPLAISYKNNTFAVNKTGLKVARDDKSLAYVFANKALSVRMANDSFMVSNERFAGVYKNYKLGFDKTAGINYEDGTRKVSLSKENIAASQDDMKLNYSVSANEITIEKGENYSLFGAPGKVGVVLDKTKIGFTSDEKGKTLEVDIPGFKKVSAGIDQNNLAFMNFNPEIKEIAGGYSVTHDDKVISYGTDGLKVNMGKDMALSYTADNKFNAVYSDFKAFYNSSADFGAEYKDAKVKVTPALKELAYGDKYVQLSDKNELKLFVEPSRTLTVNLSGKANVVFDDITFDFEKSKTLAVKYKKDYSFKVDEKGISTEVEDNNLAYEVGKALTLKQGKENQVTITASSLETKWAGYNFSVGKDSLGFYKDGNAVSVSAAGARVVTGGKSLVYVAADKQVKFFYDANKFVEASSEAFNAKWDDAAIAYGKASPLKIAYKENSFVLGSKGLRLSDGSRSIAYNFDQSASYRQGTDSFSVSKSTVFAKYQNYNFSFDKTNGLSYNDGSRSALINGDKVAINIDDVSMSYLASKTEVSFRKGSENELTASPDGASLTMEGVKIAYMNDNGAKKLEFDVPQFAKIYAGYDPKGGNFVNFSKDNIQVDIAEKDGGYEVKSGDKSIFASSKELKFNYSSAYNFSVAENKFAMKMGDMNAYYNAITDFGMGYQQAKFDVTADRAKLAVGDKYLSVDKDNNLRLQLQDNRYVTANPTSLNVLFDDVTAQVEKDKQVLLKYKEDNSLKITEKGLDLASGNRSLNFIVGESISVKHGQNTLQIGKKGLATNWSGYAFTLNEDSLSFAKGNASVKASPTGARVSYEGKSVKYEQGKALEMYYDNTKYLSASADAIKAQWDDASMSYGKSEPLKLAYQQNSFTLGKTALQLANGDNVLTYKFDQTLSFRMKSDSFMVNKESVLAKYSNYNFSLDKTKGLLYSDGSRSAEVSSSKIAIDVEDVKMYFDATKTEVGFQKGSENQLTASPEGASLMMEGVKIAYFKDNGAHKLQFDVPKFATIYGGYDSKGGNFLSFKKDNIDFAITEKNGGYEFVTGDKMVSYGTGEVHARYGQAAYLNLVGTDFDMKYNDLAAYYKSVDNMGMSYKDAQFAVTEGVAKLVYDKYAMSLNTKTNILRASMADNRYLEATASGKVDFKYDDILASFEKDKSLAVNYKDEHKIDVSTTGAKLTSGDKQLIYEAGKSITVKVGDKNSATLTAEKLATTWEGYNFSVGKDSLGFEANGAKVAVTASAAIASYDGKSLQYESGKSLKIFYDEKKFVEASPSAAKAQWDDVSMSYAKNEELKLAYQKNEFALNKTALKLSDGDGRELKYLFTKAISVKVASDSFVVNENSLAAKYDKYNLSFNKTTGLSFNDGSRSLNANASRIDLKVDEVAMYYDATKTEIGFKRGTEQELIASPTKSVLKMEGVSIAYFRNNGSHELEFDVPSFAKVSAGYDPKGQSMFSFAKDNVAFSVMEKDGGVEFKTLDKIAFMSPTAFNFYYSNDMYMKYAENNFDMKIKDFTAYYKAKDNFGMQYNDAKFIVEPTFARLAYNDKYISLDTKKNLRVQYEPTKYLIASPTTLKFNYDDVAFDFEKGKQLAMSYKEEHKLQVNTSGIEAITGDKSLAVDFEKKTLLIKEGTTNSVAASEKGMDVDWATYKFSVSSDSLGFKKDDALVSAAKSGLRVAYKEKSLSFATATKTFKVNYDAAKYVTLSPEALGARWDDMGVDFEKNTSLSLFVKDKKFAINKDNISLSQDDAKLMYKFAGELSVRYKNDSLNVSKTKVVGKIDKYSMDLSKENGAILSDGSKTYKLKDKAEITYSGYTVSYDLNSKAIGLRKGDEWGISGSSSSLKTFFKDHVLSLHKDSGVYYRDKKNYVKIGEELVVTSTQFTALGFGIKKFTAAKPEFYLNYEKYGISYAEEQGYKFAYDKNWASIAGSKTYFATHWDDLDIDIQQNGRMSASKAGYGLVYGGDLVAGVIADGSEITLSKTYELGLKDKKNDKGVLINSNGIVTLINGKQKIIAGGSQPIRFETDGMKNPSDGSADEMKFTVAGMDMVVKPADGNNITIETKVVGLDIYLETSGEGTMKTSVSKDGKKYGTLYKNFYSWGVSIGDQNADTDGPKVDEPVKMNGPANIGYITQNSTSVLQVVIYASYSSKTNTFVLNGQATGSQPMLCTRNVTLAAKFAPDDWYIKVADRPREKWASIKPLCLFVETQGYFYVDKNIIAAGVNYGYHFDINTGWVTIVPEVFKAKVGAYFNFDIGGEGVIQMRPKFAIPYIRIWLDASAGIYGCVNFFGGDDKCATLIGVRIGGELILVITDSEKSAAGKLYAGVTIVGKTFDAEFSAKVKF